MKILRLILKIFMWATVTILGLLLLVSVLLYLPSVQQLIKDKTTNAISESLGIDLSIEKIRLKFPLRITLDNMTLRTPEGDTIASLGSFSAKAALGPLIKGKLALPRLKLEDVSVNYTDSVSAVHLYGRLGSMSILDTEARLSEHSVRISRISLTKTDITLDSGESRAKPDTISSDTTSAPWRVNLGQLDIDEMSFRMNTYPHITELIASIAAGQLEKLDVDLATQTIDAGELSIKEGAYSYLSDTVKVANTSADNNRENEPWTVRLGRLELTDNAVRYGTLYGSNTRQEFDPANITADNLNLTIDSVFNRGAEISATIASLSLRERSGLTITETQGHFSMTPEAISLEGFSLHTPTSKIQADLRAAPSLLDMAQNAELSADISAEMSSADLFLLYPAEKSLHNALDNKSFILESRISGTLGDISVQNLRAQIPNHINLQASGRVRSVTDPANMAGEIKFSGNFNDIGFIAELLPDSTRNIIGFPSSMSINGTLSAVEDNYASAIALSADSGYATINGKLNTRTESYSAKVILDDFPLGTFLPADSLGTVSINITASGHGWDPVSEKTATEITADINRFEYKDYNFSDISIRTTLIDHILSGNLSSRNEALQFDLALGGELEDSLYAASLKGRIFKTDLQALGFAEEPLTVSLTLDANASAQTTDSTYRANIILDSIRIVNGMHTEQLGQITLQAASDRDSVTAKLISGDLQLSFVSPESIATLANSFGKAASMAKSQIDSLRIDMRPIGESLPAFRLDFSAGRENPLRDYLYKAGVDFNHISASAGNSYEKPVAAGIVVNGLHTGNLMLDTLNVWLGQNEEKLAYGVRVRNLPGNIDQVAFIGLGGTLSGNRATANLWQRDRADNTGFRFGITAELLDSAVRVSLTPSDPVFGYRQWHVNENNYFTFHFDKRMEADLRLEGKDANQYFRITSINRQNMPPGSVKLELSGIDLGEAFSLLPAAPPIEGILGGDGTIGLSDRIIKGDLILSLTDFYYEGQRVGDLTLGATANNNENNLWDLDLYLSADQKTVLTALGSYDVGNTGAIDIKVTIPELQLALANAFLPDDMARLSGTANGEVNLSGTLAKPIMTGGLAFANASITVPMIGTTFRISDERIAIANGKINFDDFGLVAPNSQKLALDGDIDINDFSAIRANLELFASNFEAVNAPRSRGSQIYGIAALDIDITLRGLLDALVVRGNINMLSRTNVYYTMRDSPLEVKEAKQDIVTFVSFTDEETWTQVDSLPLRRQSSIDVLVNVDIQDNVRATVNLAENGSSRIELTGDGSLAFTMNSQGDTRLSGRYTLSGGQVIYAVPVIGTKEFGINDGSYVEWTGEIANPSFNITATEATPIRMVSQDGAVTVVTFDIIIHISNTLDDMAISFNLQAPRNGDIQNELQSLTAEERSSKAMYMLITNTYESNNYTSDSGGFNVNQQIGALISKELNQWARNNLQGVELSVGIDTVDDGDGTAHTDYSYSVSKSLFDDRFKVTVGGSVTDNPTANATENLVDDIVIEYRLTKRDNMFIKIYRYNTQENILEGEVVETGAGFVLRKRMNRLRDLFKLTQDPALRRERQKAREIRRQVRDEELLHGIDPAKEQKQDLPMPSDNSITSQSETSIPKDGAQTPENSENQNQIQQ